ncbi:MAG TPA: SAP domain-containing protein [Desulfuromonadales bacterium]|nr:SAP domain-containing protein [Desulfuromonadales bacterium]
MKLEEIKEIAKQHSIKTGKMKKAELVKAIQQAEGNVVCFETNQSDTCGQNACLWRPDCK